MNRLKFLLAAFVVGVLTFGIYSCSKDKPIDSESKTLTDYKILDNSYKSPRVTFGKQPTSEFYNTVFNYISSNNSDINKIIEELNIKLTSRDKFWLTVYSDKVYSNQINISKDDIIGVGICELLDGNLKFSVYTIKATNPELLTEFNFGTKFPTRIFEHFKSYFGKDELKIKSMIFINNNSSIKLPIENNVSKEFNDVMNKILYSRGSASRFDCGCDGLPCCDEDGCGFAEDLAYCGWETIQGPQQTWQEYNCKSCGSCSGRVISDTDEFDMMQPELFLEESYGIRDNLLSKSTKGKLYTRYYYDLHTKYKLSQILAANTNLQNAHFAYTTLLKSKKLLYGSSSDIIIDNSYYVETKSILNNLKLSLSNNSELIEMVNNIENDIEKYKGWTKDQILNDLK